MAPPEQVPGPRQSLGGDTWANVQSSSVGFDSGLVCFPFLDVHLVGGLGHFLLFHILGITIPIEQYFSEKLKPPTSQNLPMESSVKQDKITHDGPLDRYLGPALNGRGIANAWFPCRFSFTDGK